MQPAQTVRSHHSPFAALAGLLLLSGCATAGPRPVDAPSPDPPAPARSNLVGLDRAAVEAGLGPPLLVVREGAVTRLQWRARACVLDLTVMPQGPHDQVVLAEARDAEGADVPLAGCVAALSR